MPELYGHVNTKVGRSASLDNTGSSVKPEKGRQLTDVHVRMN